MMFPTVHMNGTSKKDLLEALDAAHAAVLEAQRLLAQTAPNGRDYYLQPDPRAFYKAQDEHCARMQKLVDVQRELEEQGEHLALGPDNFGRRG